MGYSCQPLKLRAYQHSLRLSHTGFSNGGIYKVELGGVDMPLAELVFDAGDPAAFDCLEDSGNQGNHVPLHHRMWAFDRDPVDAVHMTAGHMALRGSGAKRSNPQHPM